MRLYRRKLFIVCNHPAGLEVIGIVVVQVKPSRHLPLRAGKCRLGMFLIYNVASRDYVFKGLYGLMG